MSLTSSKLPRLADKLEAQARDARKEIVAAESELSAIKIAKKRAKKN